MFCTRHFFKQIVYITRYITYFLVTLQRIEDSLHSRWLLDQDSDQFSRHLQIVYITRYVTYFLVTLQHKEDSLHRPLLLDQDSNIIVFPPTSVLLLITF